MGAPTHWRLLRDPHFPWADRAGRGTPGTRVRSSHGAFGEVFHLVQARHRGPHGLRKGSNGSQYPACATLKCSETCVASACALRRAHSPRPPRFPMCQAPQKSQQYTLRSAPDSWRRSSAADSASRCDRYEVLGAPSARQWVPTLGGRLASEARHGAFRRLERWAMATIVPRFPRRPGLLTRPDAPRF